MRVTRDALSIEGHKVHLRGEGERGSVMVEAPGYKPEVRGFEKQ
jgi:hypothetical protein